MPGVPGPNAAHDAPFQRASPGADRPTDPRNRPPASRSPFGKGSSGRIRVTIENKDIDLIATCDEGEVEEGREVLIVSAKNGEAKVTLVR